MVPIWHMPSARSSNMAQKILTWPSRSGKLQFPIAGDHLLRRISSLRRNHSQPYFFKRNQSSDNCSHGFGTKFLLKKLSASDFSCERKSAFSSKSSKMAQPPFKILLGSEFLLGPEQQQHVVVRKF